MSAMIIYGAHYFMHLAGLIYDDSPHYLDHLGPLCALLRCPLILCEPTLADTARAFYPDLEVLEIPLWELHLPPRLITCDNIPLLQAAFPSQTPQIFWLPHGNSDKGWNGPFFEGIGPHALIYGQKMADFMRAKNACTTPIPIGNFRRHYAEMHHSFYRQILSLPPQSLLYAPTWDDAEKNNSFWDAFPRLAHSLSATLLVKLHPNTHRQFPAEVERMIGKYASPHIRFLPDIPPIYPILSQCDAYIGDASSIGYDFLAFNKPLYFLNTHTPQPLHRCGTPFSPQAFLKTDTLSPIRQETYRQTFAPLIDFRALKQRLEA